MHNKALYVFAVNCGLTRVRSMRNKALYVFAVNREFSVNCVLSQEVRSMHNKALYVFAGKRCKLL
jgi:hypothetical protein